MDNILASMTGYARVASSHEQVNFHFEMKSVNSRGLDIRLRLGSNFDAIEQKIRKATAEKITRGSVTISLTLKRENSVGELTINQHALESVISATKTLSKKINIPKIRLGELLSLGVLEKKDNLLDEKAQRQLEATVFAAFEQCLAELISSRQQEGAELKQIISQRLNEIEKFTEQAENHPARSKAAILTKLQTQISELANATPLLSEERLNQEALLLATKADIREELDRLVTHVKAAREFVAGGGAVGRKLDFLSQEFNREANTLCAKSNSVDLSAIGLDLKAVIDQLREQVQNIE